MPAVINPVELFVGLRYLRAKRRTRFVSFITLISLLGIALGVAALIVILSIMNGFEGELRNRLLSMSAHGFVSGADGRTDDWQELTEAVAAEPGVAAAAPYVSMEGMIQASRDLEPVFVHGIDPTYEDRLSGELINLVEGRLESLAPGSRGIILGRLLAYDIGARLGDGIVLLIPRPVGDGTMQAGSVNRIRLSVDVRYQPESDALDPRYFGPNPTGTKCHSPTCCFGWLTRWRMPMGNHAVSG